MDYKSQLELLSQTIYRFDFESSTLVASLISSETLDHLKVYQRNLYGAGIKALWDKFISLRRYWGDSNFQYWVREFITAEGFTSVDLTDVPDQFSNFLSKMAPVIDDEIVTYLTALDLLWSANKSSSTSVPKGFTHYWLHLMEETSPKECTIDFNDFEQVSLEVKNENKVIRLSSRGQND